MPGNQGSNQVSKHSRTFTENNMMASPEATISVDDQPLSGTSQSKPVTQSNNSLPNKKLLQSNPGAQVVQKSSSQNMFPMTPEDLVRNYGKMLSAFERDEALDHKDPIYYVNFNTNYKGHGKYHKNEINYLDENPEKNITASGILNNGFSNE